MWGACPGAPLPLTFAVVAWSMGLQLVLGTALAWLLARRRFAGRGLLDALVTIAVVGAVIIGEYWEAAAVTFLFMLGDYLESRTIDKTRSSIKALLDLAPDIAVVTCDAYKPGQGLYKLSDIRMIAAYLPQNAL